MKPKMHKAFTDAEGAVSLEQIVEIATALPEAIRKVPVDQLKKVMPALQQIMSYASEQGAMPAEGDGEDMPTEDADANPTDEEGGEDQNKFADSLSKILGRKIVDADGAKAAIEKHRREFADAEVKRYAEVVNKARSFLDAEYDYTGKTANQVMRDALATQSTDQFEDAELSVAFKLLRKPNTDYSQFGDAKPGSGLESRIKQSLGEE